MEFLQETTGSAASEITSTGATNSRRSIAAKRSHDRRRAELLAAIKGWEPEVQSVLIAEARTAAIASYNRRYKRKRASSSDSKKFLDRITVNYIRHHLTSYDGLLRTLRGRTGKPEAVGAARDKTLIRIAQLYPDLLAACGNQCTSDDSFSAITQLPAGARPRERRRRRRRRRSGPNETGGALPVLSTSAP